MFRRLRTARYLKNGATADEAWVGWIGGAATIAGVHQDGGTDRPAKKGKPVRYARRILLGLSDGERNKLAKTLIEQVISD